MSTKLGSSTRPSYGYEWSGVNTLNQQCKSVTLPAGGPWRIVTLGAWLAGKSAAADVKLAAWDSTRNTVMGSSAAFSAPSGGSGGNGQSDSYEKAVSTPFDVAGGTTLYIGWSRDEADVLQWDTNSAGTHYDDTDTTGSWPGSAPRVMSGEVSDSTGIGAWLYYEAANTLPSAPTQTSPASASVQTTATPSFGFTHVDADSDPCASYDIQVDNNSDFSSPTWDGINLTSGIVGNNITVTYAGSALSRGTTYYWRVRTNDGTGDGTWSSGRTFIYNALPTVVKNAPTAGTLGVIHNLGELALWTPGVAAGNCQFKFTPTDTAGGSLQQYQLRIWDAAAAGTMVYDSGATALAMTSGVQVTVDVPFDINTDTARWWTIDVYDGYEWAGVSSRTEFKLLYAQALFEFDTGADSTGWGFVNGTTVEQIAILFRSATSTGFDAATGKTAWSASIGSVVKQRYLQVLVRLTTDTTTVPASLADMTFSYYGTPSVPDGWTVA